MLKGARIQRLRGYLRDNKYATITDITALMGISRATAYRDLNELSKSSEFVVTRGGAFCNSFVAGAELPYAEKRQRNHAEKVRIAREACGFVRAGSTIILDTGTTTREMATFIKEMRDLHVVTNDVLIAAELADNQEIDITVTGGAIRKGYYTLRGHFADLFLTQVKVDVVFLSADSVSVEGGCMITNMDELSVKQKMIRAAERAVVLCDHSKIGRKSFSKVCDLPEIDVLITGRELIPALAEELRGVVSEMVLA
ncbi:MAG: DeoR/GlpR family DNA-binding transcription regulator [Deltaproteobacteria bacterium]|jgi:DeoR/GlpR family transcriptional regulator of sugar metabolism|nr:DeoR/GlpR family DNA-binding transcription regulator [Deltaproteobacteria bacterium]